MIFDRKKSDVSDALRIREEKVKKFLPLTEEETEIIERGFLTVGAINRIESAEKEIKEVINKMGYWGAPIKNKSWNEIRSALFYMEDYDRILGNAQDLVSAFFKHEETPRPQGNEIKFQNLNALEKTLHLLYIMIDDVQGGYVECGNSESGQEDTHK